MVGSDSLVSRHPQSAPRTYDRISSAYDLVADPAEHDARERGLALLDARSGERVLEIGAGTGRALAELASAVGPSGLVSGLDSSWGMLALARRRTSGTCVHVEQGDGRCLPFRQGSFDAAFMSFTLELFEPPDIARVLAELARVLRPSGRLAVVSLDASAGSGLVVSAYGWLHRHLPHWIDCRPIEVLRLLGEAGYRTTRTETLGLFGLSVMVALAHPPA